MFEGLRKNSQSFMLVILIASLATIFGVSFGHGSRGCNSGSIRVAHIARVYGATVSEQDFQSEARMVGLNEQRNSAVLRQAIVDGLIERELLAHEAERLGYRVSDDDLNREIRDGYYYVSLGMHEMPALAGPFGVAPISARRRTSYSRSAADNADTAAPPPFSYEDFEGWVRGYYGRTVPDYKRMLSREMLAEWMRTVITSNVRVSEDEVWRDYARQHNQVSLRYVAFTPDFYRDVVRDDDQAAVDAFAQAHADQINQQYAQRRESLQHLPDQIRIRSILIRFPEDAQEPSRIATQQRAQAIRDRIAAGEDFVRLARLYSQDDHDWRSGGESGWVTRDHLDVPDDVKVALRDVPAGTLTQPIQSPLGYFIVQVQGTRHGDIPEADAKREIARELYKLVHGNELAAAAADHAQQLLNAPGATLETVAAAVHAEALTQFYRGDIPGTVTLAGNNNLETVTHTDVGAPELRETQSFTHTASIPGIENSQPIVAAAYTLTEEHPSPSAPIAAGDARYIIRLKDRQVASRDEFNHDRQQLMDDFEVAKRREALEQYIARLRADAERKGELHIGNSPLLQQQRASQREREDESG